MTVCSADIKAAASARQVLSCNEFCPMCCLATLRRYRAAPFSQRNAPAGAVRPKWSLCHEFPILALAVCNLCHLKASGHCPQMHAKRPTRFLARKRSDQLTKCIRTTLCPHSHSHPHQRNLPNTASLLVDNSGAMPTYPLSSISKGARNKHPQAPNASASATLGFLHISSSVR